MGLGPTEALGGDEPPARHNEFDQPVGFEIPAWSVRPLPDRVTLNGTYARIEPMDAARHSADLFAAYQAAPDTRDWTYLPAERPNSLEDFRAYARRLETSTDPLHYTVCDLGTGRAAGTLSLLRHDPANGVVEVGYVVFSPLLKQTAISTEAQYLLMSYAFDDLGYRRYEWKCDSLNAPSRRAAERLGFRFEGIFRQAVVYKGRNRDTAWYAIVDEDWPRLKVAFEVWLAPENFDEEGAQRRSLARIRAGSRS